MDDYLAESSRSAMRQQIEGLRLRKKGFRKDGPSAFAQMLAANSSDIAKPQLQFIDEIDNSRDRYVHAFQLAQTVQPEL